MSIKGHPSSARRQDKMKRSNELNMHQYKTSPSNDTTMQSQWQYPPQVRSASVLTIVNQVLLSIRQPAQTFAKFHTGHVRFHMSNLCGAVLVRPLMHWQMLEWAAFTRESFCCKRRTVDVCQRRSHSFGWLKVPAEAQVPFLLALRTVTRAWGLRPWVGPRVPPS